MNNFLDIVPAAQETEKPKRPRIEPGYYPDLSNDEYHGSQGYSSTKVKRLLEQTPAHMEYFGANPKESTAAMALGTAFHTLTLEPHKFHDEVFVMPELNLRTKAGRKQKEKYLEDNKKKAVITPEQFEAAKAMSQAALNHPIASLLLADSICESSIYWWYKAIDPDDETHYKMMAKVRPDSVGVSHRLLIDLKSTDDATYSAFQRTILKFNYHVSAAMYMDGVNQCKELLELTGHHAFKKFVFIVVESSPPHQVACYDLSEKFLNIGKFLYRSAFYKLYQAKQNNFPSFPEEVREIEPPSWAERFHIV